MYIKDIPLLDPLIDGEEGIISSIEILKKHSALEPHIDTCILFFEDYIDENMKNDLNELFTFKAACSKVPQYIYKNQIVMAFSPLGGPASAGLIEELIALGVKKIIACGSAGALDLNITNHIFLIEDAIRDEGMSYQYLKPELKVATDKNLTQQVKTLLESQNILVTSGTTWTTDGFYRETPSRLKMRLSQGAKAVEMEAASMAAVAQFRGIQFAQVLYFSDVLTQKKWSGFTKTRAQLIKQMHACFIDIALSISKSSESSI